MEPNPVRELRTLVGVSQTAFASVAGVSRQTLVNVEAGMYEEIPLRIHRALTDAVRDAGVPPQRVLRDLTLPEAYRQWQTLKREELEERLAEWPLLTLEEIVARFKTPGTFCRALCVPTASLHHALREGGRIPSVIHIALKEAGYRYVDWAAA